MTGVQTCALPISDLAAKGLEVLEQEYLSESNQIAGMSEYAKFSIAQKDKLEEVLHAHELLYAKIVSEKLDAKIPKTQMVQVTDPAEPGRAPVKPNKTLDIIFGVMMGIVLGTIAGGLAVWVSSRRANRRKNAAAV